MNHCVLNLTFGLDSSIISMSRANPLLSSLWHNWFQPFPPNKRTVQSPSPPLPGKRPSVNSLCWCDLSSKQGPDKALVALLIQSHITLAAFPYHRSKPFSGLLETEIQEVMGGGFSPLYVFSDLTELWLGLRWADVCVILFPGAEGTGREAL